MKKSELIEKLTKSLKEDGDEHLRYVKIVSLEQSDTRSMYSPTRTLKSGKRANINQKEFEQYCKDNTLGDI